MMFSSGMHTYTQRPFIINRGSWMVNCIPRVHRSPSLTLARNILIWLLVGFVSSTSFVSSTPVLSRAKCCEAIMSWVSSSQGDLILSMRYVSTFVECHGAYLFVYLIDGRFNLLSLTHSLTERCTSCRRWCLGNDWRERFTCLGHLLRHAGQSLL